MLLLVNVPAVVPREAIGTMLLLVNVPAVVPREAIGTSRQDCSGRVREPELARRLRAAGWTLSLAPFCPIFVANYGHFFNS